MGILLGPWLWQYVFDAVQEILRKFERTVHARKPVKYPQFFSCDSVVLTSRCSEIRETSRTNGSTLHRMGNK